MLLLERAIATPVSLESLRISVFEYTITMFIFDNFVAKSIFLFVHVA